VLAGIRRALLILIAIAAPTAVFSLLLGLAAGSQISRAVATGFYLVGASLMVVGLLSGVRGPVRAIGTSDAAGAPLFGSGLFAPRRFRKATDEERRDALSTAVLLLVLGLVLVAFGVVADAEVELL
jgi:hypothetical protein